MNPHATVKVVLACGYTYQTLAKFTPKIGDVVDCTAELTNHDHKRSTVANIITKQWVARCPTCMRERSKTEWGSTRLYGPDKEQAQQDASRHLRDTDHDVGVAYG